MYLQTLQTILKQKFDTSLFVQKPYLRTNDLESMLEEDTDVKNQ